MITNSDLSKISQINENIFISGIFPLDSNHTIIKKMNIKFILACLDRNFISEVHNKIILNDPDIMILYLPCNDDINQNLWTKNTGKADLVKYINSMPDYDKLVQKINMYNGKPLIEIGYHFINSVVAENKNILVHCIAGVSRSVSMVVYFLMKKMHMTYEGAITMVKSKRQSACPNDSFRAQLTKYQEKRDQFTESDANDVISCIKIKKE